MVYFLVNNCNNCIKLLEIYDTVGCNYLENPNKHYSGNFWWANSNYVKKLSKITTNIRHDAEWWLLSNKDINSYSIHNSLIDHYHEENAKEKYLFNINIVVARYNENIEWSNQFKNGTIYNKGDKLNNSYCEILLTNVGREGHTYYTHICDNYDNLDEYIIFLQGNPFDHSPNIINNLLKYINDNELDIDFEFLSENVIHSFLDRECRLNKQCKNIFNTYEIIFNKKYDSNECIFGAGAQFIVSRRQILKKPKSFYRNIVKILENNINPDEGHDIERLHKYILSN
jgi:hypothetical protein